MTKIVKETDGSKLKVYYSREHAAITARKKYPEIYPNGTKGTDCVVSIGPRYATILKCEAGYVIKCELFKFATFPVPDPTQLGEEYE